MRPWAQWTATTALLGVVGTACQVGTAVLPPAVPASVIRPAPAARATRTFRQHPSRPD